MFSRCDRGLLANFPEKALSQVYLHGAAGVTSPNSAAGMIAGDLLQNLRWLLRGRCGKI